MSDRVTLTLATADGTKKAQVSLPVSTTVADLLKACKKNWSLPEGEDFALRDPSRNAQLNSKETLASAGIANGAELQVYPLLEAGN